MKRNFESSTDVINNFTFFPNFASITKKYDLRKLLWISATFLKFQFCNKNWNIGNIYRNICFMWYLAWLHSVLYVYLLNEVLIRLIITRSDLSTIFDKIRHVIAYLMYLYFQSYFKDSWNTFDFVTVVGSIVDALMVEFAVSFEILWYIFLKIHNEVI